MDSIVSHFHTICKLLAREDEYLLTWMDSFSFLNKVFEIDYKNSKIDIDANSSAAVDKLNEDLHDAFCLSGDILELLILQILGDRGVSRRDIVLLTLLA